MKISDPVGRSVTGIRTAMHRRCDGCLMTREPAVVERAAGASGRVFFGWRAELIELGAHDVHDHGGDVVGCASREGFGDQFFRGLFHGDGVQQIEQGFVVQHL